MPKLSETELEHFEAGRDLEAELQASLQAAKLGELGDVWVDNGNGQRVRSEVAKIRLELQLSQPRFATLLGVSTRTLQAWEQGRRQPSGSARSLLKIAKARPDVLKEVLL